MACTQFVNISGYRFVRLYDTHALADTIKSHCGALDLRGSVIFSPEGVNIYLSGPRQDVDRFTAYLCSIKRFEGMQFKESFSDTHSYPKFKVKLKSHVVPSDLPVSPEDYTVRNMPPKELKDRLDAGEDLILVDTRNYYETEAGLFENAVDLNIQHFKDLPGKMAQELKGQEKKPVVMYCTGGIRCEKGGPIAEALGFEEVYQLEGGILNYFKECGGAHYKGDCYVFDERVALKPDLTPSGVGQCGVCQHILAPEQQACPNC